MFTPTELQTKRPVSLALLTTNQSQTRSRSVGQAVQLARIRPPPGTSQSSTAHPSQHNAIRLICTLATFVSSLFSLRTKIVLQ